MIKFFIVSNKPLDLYRCILANQYIYSHTQVIIFNDEKVGLPVRNNEFIDHFDCDVLDKTWFVFMHDDVAFLEDPTEKIESLPRDQIYGLCGVKKKDGKGRITGQIRQPHPNRSGEFVLLGDYVKGHEIVSTFDSLCTIVHGSLLMEYPQLRFDEHLKYHMHVEEFSINAKKNFNINSAVVQIDCIHMSWGKKDAPFYEAVDYVKKKHNLDAYISTCDKFALNHYQDNDGWKEKINA
jgi:hypothetical protein